VPATLIQQRPTLFAPTERIGDVLFMRRFPIRSQGYQKKYPSFKLEHYLLIPIASFLLIFLGYPLVSVINRSFVDNVSLAPTMSNYARAFGSARYTGALRNSLLFSAACTLVAAVIGTFVGLMTSRLPRRQKSIMLSILSLPLTLSGLVVAFSFIVLFGRNGVINLLIRRASASTSFVLFDLYGWNGLLFVYSFFNVPQMALTMSAVFGNLDTSLVEAARNAGAKPWQTWTYVILPVLAPGFMAGISIVFAGMMGAFGTALALTGMAKNLFSLQVYSHTSEASYNLPQASALAVMLIATTAFILWVFGILTKRLGRQHQLRTTKTVEESNYVKTC
jgi:putative spermidine/putrescine transport system permease protein